METIRIESVSPPFAEPGTAAAAARVIAFAGTTGLLKDVVVNKLDQATWNRVIERFRDVGVARFRAFADLREPLARGRSLSQSIEDIYDAIEASPMPRPEWKSMRELLKDDLLAKLLGVSRQSIVRYAQAERATPQDVAERLHVIALIASDLAGSYNEFGIRRWFERPRAQLGGKSPAAILRGEWKPDGEQPRKVRQLAAFLSGGKAG